MKNILLTSLVALSFLSVANAQEAPKQFTLTVTTEELQVIGKALEELPFKQSAPVMNKLNTQVQQQLAPTPKPDATVKPQENK